MKTKKIPYGLSDFKRVNTQNYYYIDKTKFLATLEDDADFVFFLRPRRFGKSLSISMIEYYYDKNFANEFDTIFENTYIKNNPTPLKNSFCTMKFDFSAIDITNYQESFKHDLSMAIDNFINDYNLDLSLEKVSPIEDFKALLNYCGNHNIPLYILIDEYDNFVNKLLVEDIAKYKDIVTTNEAFYKQFFTILKVGTSGVNAPIKKMFFTGVSPLALYDVTSGSNIGKNISLAKEFNDFVGITDGELEDIISHYGLDDKKEQIIFRCKEWYNNYRFYEDIKHSIYNSDMILYYIDHLSRSGNEPRQLIDVNVRIDYSKLKYLVYTNKKLNGNFKILNNLILGKKITTTILKDNFSAFELSNVDNFKAFIFSLGLATIEKNSFALNFTIPNQTIKKLISEFIHYAYKDFENYNMRIDTLEEHLLNLAIEKDLEVFNYIGEVIKQSSSIRDYIDGENFVKAYLLAYLNINSLYEVHSEVESNKGYIDILLEPIMKEVPYGATIELKYIKREDLKSKDYENILKQKVDEASKQLNQYDKGDRYIKIVLVFASWELVYCGEV